MEKENFIRVEIEVDVEKDSDGKMVCKNEAKLNSFVDESLFRGGCGNNVWKK